MKKIIAIVVVVVVLAIGSLVALHKSPSKPVANTTKPASSKSTQQASTTNKPVSTAAPSSSPSANPQTTAPKQGSAPATTTSAPLNVTVNANDTDASPETITTSKGQVVNITFQVSTEGTYHGGLEFKSSDPSIDSGPIAEGDSKMVSFTATKSFKFTPFWYQSDVQKDYFVTVNVI